MKIKDITGLKNGKLTVLGIGKQIGYNVYWLCQCECGNQSLVCTSNFKRTKSCGCNLKENKYNLKHGQNSRNKRTEEYATWVGIKNRCHNSNNPRYKNYGARGIIVCVEWRNSFEQFFKDMGKRPQGTSIDRINNDGNYEPSNCRWATKRQQSLNTSQVLLFEYNGEQLSQSELAQKIGIPMQTLSRWRIKDQSTFEDKIKRRLQKCKLVQMG